VILKIAQNKTTDSETIKKYLDEAAKKIDAEFEKYRK
jgi:fructooligosaccharide transport system substrate-binding protein